MRLLFHIYYKMCNNIFFICLLYIPNLFLITIYIFIYLLINLFTYLLLGVRQRGLQTTEKMLRVDSIITVIGELSQSESKSDMLTLQPPLTGSPFYITTMSITTLIRKIDDRKRMYRYIL